MRKAADKALKERGSKAEKDPNFVKQLKRISYNLKAELDHFVESFVKSDGIKQIMYAIEVSQDMKDYDALYVLLQMLSIIFMYGCGIGIVEKSPRKYITKFFELSTINPNIKKQSIRILFNITANMADSYDKVEKAASNFSKESNTFMYQTLIDALE